MTASPSILRVGTRGSRLARAQTDLVLALWRTQLGPEGPFLQVSVVRTEGDRTQAAETPLQDLPRGVFVKDLEEALLQGAIDVAIHSLKDLPVDPSPGLVLAAVPEREDPRDVLVARGGCRFSDLPAGALIGTSSPRRAAQLLALRRDIRVEAVRGNVDTRVRKVQEGFYDAVVLAAAGLKRLGLESAITEYLDVQECLPDAGQGALASQARQGDVGILSSIAALNDPEAWTAVTAERALLRELGGGCTVPVGALGAVEGEDLVLHGVVASGDSLVRASARGPAAEPEALGRTLAVRLRAMLS